MEELRSHPAGVPGNDIAQSNYTFVSGIGQYHTNEPGKPTRRKYLAIGCLDIQSLVDNPQQVDKAKAQWLIPSTHTSRNFKEQEEHGQYWLLWADLDSNPPTIRELKIIIDDMLGGCDYELYNSRSATVANQKARLLIPLAEPLRFPDWNLAQQTLNDKLEALGALPDRASERAAQLCYLPNRGELYNCYSERNNKHFIPMQSWAQDITTKREKLEADKAALEVVKTQTMAKKEELELSPDLIGAFNQAYTPQEFMVTAGYAQRGDTFRHTNSESGSYSARVKHDANGLLRVNALSPSDPLYNNGAGAHDAFSTFRILNHGGDESAALKDAGDNLLAIGGVSWNKAAQIEYANKKHNDKQQCGDDAVQPIKPEAKIGGQIKNAAVKALLQTIEQTNLTQACEALGWQQGSNGKPPTDKNFIVAIIDVLIKTASKHTWRVVHNAGFFYIYDGAKWVALDDGEVKQLLKDAAIKMGYPEITSRHSVFVDNLFKQAQQDGFFIEGDLKKQSIINLKNGSLVLGEDSVYLKSFDHEDFLTHQLDFNYDRKCVNNSFLSYLETVLPNADTRTTLQQVAGYLFVKGLKMEKVFFLFGTGANGKSVFFEVLNGVIGSENISNYSLESLTDDKGYHRAMIKDRIVNYGTDIRLTKIDAGMFKTLASGEPIEARLPYRDPFMMTDYAKLIFNVNRMDSANLEHTHGFYRRFLIIPFGVTIPDHEQDRDLHKKILEDKAGVLNWIIEGARQVIANRDIFISQECEAFKKQFLKETDSVAMFESDYILTEQQYHTHYSRTVTDSYNDFRAYCKDAGHNYPLNRNNFVKRMEALGFEKRRTNTGIYLEKNYFLKKVVNDSSLLHESATAPVI